MSRANSIVVPGDKLDLAMQLIFTPLIHKLVERKRAHVLRRPTMNVIQADRENCSPRPANATWPMPSAPGDGCGAEAANSGHPGMPMGMADVATVLFNRFIKLDPSKPDWPDRDRFVLSAGHGSMLLYAIHHLLGYDGHDAEQLRQFRQLGAKTAGHPEYGHAQGIETTTGPLGQGIATAVGMALAERMMAARFGEAGRSSYLCDRRRRLPAGRHQP
jgi:hypothetical protein